MEIAFAIVRYEWSRYLSCLSTIVLAGVFVLAQVGLFSGAASAYGELAVNVNADLVVLPASSGNITTLNRLNERVRYELLMNPHVEDVEEFVTGRVMVNFTSNGEHVSFPAQIVVARPSLGDMTLLQNVNEQERAVLEQPLQIVIDETLFKARRLAIGDELLLNGRRVFLGARSKSFPSMSMPIVLASPTTVALLNLEAVEGSGPYLVRVRDGAPLEEVRDSISAVGEGRFRAWKPRDLGKRATDEALRANLIGKILAGSLAVGMLFGLGVTYQSLRGAVLANINEFAALHALGLSKVALAKIVICMGFVLGLAGAVLTMSVAVGLTKLLGDTIVQFQIAPLFIGVVVLAQILAAVFSGLLAMRVIFDAEPADLLRSA